MEKGRDPSGVRTNGFPNRDALAPLRVLLVEDDPAHAELARRAFDARPGAFAVMVAETVDAARVALATPTPPELVIADWRLPDGEGVDLLRGDSAHGLPPVVIMTSQGSERVAVEVIRAGAVDYVVKSEAALADLAHVADRALRQRRIEDAMGDLAAGTSGAGEAFFQAIVLRLSHALRVKYASVAEVVPGGRLRTLARCIDGRLVENTEYALDGTPCARALGGTVCYIRHGVADVFPQDEGLRRLDAQSYVGSVLSGADGPLGIVNAVHDHPLDEVVRPEAVVQVFASRTAAEMERRRAEKELERQRAFAESLLDMVASLVIVVDAQGRIQRFNRVCETTSGWTEDEVRGRLFWEVLRPAETRDEAARFFRGEIALDEVPTVYESVWITRSGERRLISWANRPILDDAGNMSSLMGTGVDITDSRRTEEALRASEARYRTLMRNAPEAIVVADVERSRLVDANDNAERLFGLDREQLLATDPTSFVPKRQPDGELSTIKADRLLDEAYRGCHTVGGDGLPPLGRGGAALRGPARPAPGAGQASEDQHRRHRRAQAPGGRPPAGRGRVAPDVRRAPARGAGGGRGRAGGPGQPNRGRALGAGLVGRPDRRTPGRDRVRGDLACPG